MFLQIELSQNIYIAKISNFTRMKPRNIFVNNKQKNCPYGLNVPLANAKGTSV